jgi:hypothetical protein
VDERREPARTFRSWRDVRELQAAHLQLRTSDRGRQWGQSGINRAAVALIVSAWEA